MSEVAALPKREGVIYPKFRDQFAVADFDANPMPVLSLYPIPGERALSELEIQTCGVTGERRRLSWSELRGLPRMTVKTSLICQIFNWAQEVIWEGIRLTDFLDFAGLDAPEDGSFAFYSADQFYFETLPKVLARDPRVLLAYGLNGEPLPLQHGGPLRLVVPFLQGYKSVKWLHSIRTFRRDPLGIKRLLGQSKTGWLGQLWQDRASIVTMMPGNGEWGEI